MSQMSLKFRRLWRARFHGVGSSVQDFSHQYFSKAYYYFLFSTQIQVECSNFDHLNQVQYWEMVVDARDFGSWKYCWVDWHSISFVELWIERLFPTSHLAFHFIILHLNCPFFLEVNFHQIQFDCWNQYLNLNHFRIWWGQFNGLVYVIEFASW